MNPAKSLSFYVDIKHSVISMDAALNLLTSSFYNFYVSENNGEMP
jgi:hypothetical protein